MFRHDHAQGVGLMFGETAGQQIRTVIQLADRSFHATSQSRAHPAGVVDDRRHGEYRNFGLAGYIVDAWCLRGPVRCSRSFYLLSHKKLRLYNTIKASPSLR